MSLIVRRNSNMSTDYLRIIPETPDFVPDEGRQKRVVSYLRSIAADAEDVTASVSEHIEFVDCGCNFESIACPSCGVRVELKHWHAWMEVSKSLETNRRLALGFGLGGGLFDARWPDHIIVRAAVGELHRSTY